MRQPSRIRSSHLALSVSVAAFFFASKVLDVNGGESKVDREGYVRPDRTLTTDELAFLVETSDLLMRKPSAGSTSKQDLERINSKRRLAATKLGTQLGHRAAIPILAAILRDEGDDPAVRSAAANALAEIGDPLAVEILIENIPEGAGVGNSAEWALIRMMYVGVGRKKGDGFEELPPEKRLERQAQWRAWWNKNKDRFTLRPPIGSVETFLTEEEWEAQIPKK
jgi:hypothetical protein